MLRPLGRNCRRTLLTQLMDRFKGRTLLHMESSPFLISFSFYFHLIIFYVSIFGIIFICNSVRCSQETILKALPKRFMNGFPLFGIQSFFTFCVLDLWNLECVSAHGSLSFHYFSLLFSYSYSFLILTNRWYYFHWFLIFIPQLLV